MLLYITVPADDANESISLDLNTVTTILCCSQQVVNWSDFGDDSIHIFRFGFGFVWSMGVLSTRISNNHLFHQDCRLRHKGLPNFDFFLRSLLLGILAPILLFPEYFCIFQLVFRVGFLQAKTLGSGVSDL